MRRWDEAIKTALTAHSQSYRYNNFVYLYGAKGVRRHLPRQRLRAHLMRKQAQTVRNRRQLLPAGCILRSSAAISGWNEHRQRTSTFTSTTGICIWRRSDE